GPRDGARRARAARDPRLPQPLRPSRDGRAGEHRLAARRRRARARARRLPAAARAGGRRRRRARAGGAPSGVAPGTGSQYGCARAIRRPPTRRIRDVTITLVAVAGIAGIATFLSPCVLPVLPVVAAASVGGGRRRPLGIAVGLAAAFVIVTLTASRLLSALGLPQDLLRNLAIALLAVVGLALLLPPLAALAGR